MKVELLVSAWCASCHQAEQVWQQVARERNIDFAVIDMAQPEGRALVSRLRLKTIPAVVVDDALRGLGVPTLAQAREWVASAPAKQQSNLHNAGMSLSLDNRLFIIAAVVYLMLGGMGLVVNGTLLSDGPARPVALHLVTVGFMLMFVYGLGAHMLPRFTANPIRMGAWPWLQMGLAHAGLIAYVTGFLAGWQALIVAGGAMIWLSIWLFAWRIWSVLWPRPDKSDGIVIRVHQG